MENTKIVRMEIRKGQKPTQEQINEINEAFKRPVTPEEDAPELTLEQYAEMAEIARQRKGKKTKPVAALRITRQKH